LLNTALLRGTFAVMATLADICAITLTAILIGNVVLRQPGL
jgi:hypothetical protein